MRRGSVWRGAERVVLAPIRRRPIDACPASQECPLEAGRFPEEPAPARAPADAGVTPPGADERRPQRPSGVPLWSALAGILLVAAAIRFWRIGWGIDHELAFADEILAWGRLLESFQRLRWSSFLGNPLSYPPLFGELVGLSFAAAKALGMIAAQDNLYAGLLLARCVSATVSVVAVALVYRVGARAYGRCAGLAGAALLASLPRAALQTHYVSVDELLAATIALTLLASCAFTARRTPLRAFACGACCALAATAKYNGILIAVAPAWVLLEVAVAERSARRVLLLGAAFAAGFLLLLPIACPPCLLESARVRAAVGMLQYLSESTTWRPPNNHVTLEIGWYGRRFLHPLFAGLPFALGVPAYLVGLLGVAVALRRRTPDDRVLLIALAAWFLFVGNMEVTFQRYLQPLLPMLAVLGGRGLLALRLRAAVTAAVTTLVVAYGLALGGSQIARLSYDQQIGVAQWIAASHPETERAQLRVVVPSPAPAWLQLDAPLRRVGVKIIPVPTERWLDERADVLIVPEWLAISIRRDPARAALRSGLDRLESGEAGYRQVARFDDRFFNQGFYTWLDPGFASSLWMGAIGFRIYVPDAADPKRPP